jgi:hypothetical protein
VAFLPIFREAKFTQNQKKPETGDDMEPDCSIVSQGNKTICLSIRARYPISVSRAQQFH